MTELNEHDTFDFDENCQQNEKENFNRPPFINLVQSEGTNYDKRSYNSNLTKKALLKSVEIINSPILSKFFDNFIVAKDRYKMTSELISVYKIYYDRIVQKEQLVDSSANIGNSTFTNLTSVTTFSPEFIFLSNKDLLNYHSEKYLKELALPIKENPILHECSFVDLKNAQIDSQELVNSHTNENHQINLDISGISTDTPPLLLYSQLVASTTVTAAASLCDTSKNTKIAINWYGGWHHAQPSNYSGFCFVNDIIFGIDKLLTCYDKILYIDLDVHHGDAVEEHFKDSGSVLTFSCHKFHPGFFPGTGETREAQMGSAASLGLEPVNVTFSKNVSSTEWRTEIVKELDNLLSNSSKNHFRTSTHSFDSIVVTCGADPLKNDPLNEGFKVELSDYLKVVKYILELNLPTLLLGGGGYQASNCSRLWTLLTMQALDLSHKTLKKMPMDISSSLVEEFFPSYKSSYRIDILS